MSETGTNNGPGQSQAPLTSIKGEADARIEFETQCQCGSNGMERDRGDRRGLFDYLEETRKVNWLGPDSVTSAVSSVRAL